MPFPPSPISLPQQPGGGGFNPPKLPYPEVRRPRGTEWSPKVELPPIASVPFSDYTDRSHPNAPVSTRYESWKMDNPSTGPYPAAHKYAGAEMDFFGPSQQRGGPADVYPGILGDWMDKPGPPRMHHELSWPNTAPKSLPYGRYPPTEVIQKKISEGRKQKQMEELIRKQNQERNEWRRKNRDPGLWPGEGGPSRGETGPVT